MGNEKEKSKSSKRSEPLFVAVEQTSIGEFTDTPSQEPAGVSEQNQVPEQQVNSPSEAGHSNDLFDDKMVTGDWGDSAPPKETVTDDEEICEVPRVLRQLENVGVRFNRTPDNHWKFGAEATAKVHKSLSVIFSVDTVCTSQDIIFGFDAAGIDADYITSVQRRNSNRTWVVSFISVEHKLMALELPSVTICGCQVFLGDAENETVLVKVYEAPNEMPDTVVIGRLAYYGRVFSFRRDRLGEGLFNDVRTARMRLREHIPSSLSIVGETIMIYYESQPRSCRKCGSKDHMASNCKTPRCLNCQEAGHRKDECPEKELCNVCLEDNHRTAFCPFVLHSANVKPQEYMAPWKNDNKDQSKAKPAERTAEQKQAIALAKQEKEKEQRRRDEKRAEEKKREERRRQEERRRDEKLRKEREDERVQRKDAEDRDRDHRHRRRERERDREERHHHHKETRERMRDESTDDTTTDDDWIEVKNKKHRYSHRSRSKSSSRYRWR